ncbi:MAG: AMP-binding protein [Phycisphaerales bacterium]|jgi:amino acid adenylation domain-containing protein
MNQVEFDPTLVHEWLRRSAKRFPDKEALICGRQRWTYEALNQLSDHLAAVLQDLGVRRQDRVIVLLDNSSETVISLYGILKAGGVFVILSGSMKGAKLRYIMENANAGVLITHTSKSKIVSVELDQIRRDLKVIWVGPTNQIPKECAQFSLSWHEIFSRCNKEAGDDQKKARQPVCIDVDLAGLIYTSSSTGDPKGVMSTHHNIISAARSIIKYIGNEQDDVILNALPLSFDYGLYQVIMAVMFGGCMVLEQSFIYLHNIMMRIAEERITGFPIVPSMVAMLLKMQDLSKYNLSSLRYITNTGAALPVQHIHNLQQLLPHTKIFSMFGLTECKRVSYLEPGELDKRPGSVGKAMPNCEVLVVDEDGKEVGSGEIGELIIRGSNVMQGYWGDPQMTSKVYHPGIYPASRWLYSGDYFKKDKDGFLYFLARKDDMIKTRGERVSPKEVENVICELEGIVEAVVVGIPDEILGQAVKAFIVPAPTAQLTEKQVMRHCAANMETVMVPRYVEFIDELPKTINGKVDKKQLESMEVKQI